MAKKPLQFHEDLRREGEIKTSSDRSFGYVFAGFFAILGDYSPAVEGLSLDEAFLDLAGTERLLGEPIVVARAIKQRVRDELSLVASVGIAPRAPETPYEYLDRVRRAGPSDTVRPIATLTRLFEIVRFSQHDVTTEMKAEAIAAHDSIVREVAALHDAAAT